MYVFSGQNARRPKRRREPHDPRAAAVRVFRRRTTSSAASASFYQRLLARACVHQPRPARTVVYTRAAPQRRPANPPFSPHAFSVSIIIPTCYYHYQYYCCYCQLCNCRCRVRYRSIRVFSPYKKNSTRQRFTVYRARRGFLLSVTRASVCGRAGRGGAMPSPRKTREPHHEIDFDAPPFGRCPPLEHNALSGVNIIVWIQCHYFSLLAAAASSRL